MLWDTTIEDSANEALDSLLLPRAARIIGSRRRGRDLACPIAGRGLRVGPSHPQAGPRRGLGKTPGAAPPGRHHAAARHAGRGAGGAPREPPEQRRGLGARVPRPDCDRALPAAGAGGPDGRGRGVGASHQIPQLLSAGALLHRAHGPGDGPAGRGPGRAPPPVPAQAGRRRQGRRRHVAPGRGPPGRRDGSDPTCPTPTWP